MREPPRSTIFSPWSLIGRARRYEQHLRETDQWVAYGFYLEFVLPTLGRIAEHGADQRPDPGPRRLTPALVDAAIALAATRGDEVTAHGAWKDFLEFLGYVPPGIDMPADSL